MHRLKEMKNTLVSCVQAELANINNANTEELGQAIDMIKDLEEAMYYCSIVKAMEEQEKESEKYKHIERHYYPYYYMPDRDMDREDYGRMYYPRTRDSQGRFTESGNGRMNYGGQGSSSGNSNGRSSGSNGGMNYYETEFPMTMRDSREGRSPISRRNYMESKELHKDKKIKIEELEKYMKELSEDLVEMIEDASPEEKQLLEKKITSLASKVASLNG